MSPDPVSPAWSAPVQALHAAFAEREAALQAERDDLKQRLAEQDRQHTLALAAVARQAQSDLEAATAARAAEAETTATRLAALNQRENAASAALAQLHEQLRHADQAAATGQAELEARSLQWAAQERDLAARCTALAAAEQSATSALLAAQQRLQDSETRLARVEAAQHSAAEQVAALQQALAAATEQHGLLQQELRQREQETAARLDTAQALQQGSFALAQQLARDLQQAQDRAHEVAQDTERAHREQMAAQAHRHGEVETRLQAQADAAARGHRLAGDQLQAAHAESVALLRRQQAQDLARLQSAASDAAQLLRVMGGQRDAAQAERAALQTRLLQAQASAQQRELQLRHTLAAALQTGRDEQEAARERWSRRDAALRERADALQAQLEAALAALADRAAAAPQAALAHPAGAAVAHVCQLLTLHGPAFVQAAYQAILGRQPDPDGGAYFLARLLSEHDKPAILVELARSEEGQARQAALAGLAELLDSRRDSPSRLRRWLVRPARIEHIALRLESVQAEFGREAQQALQGLGTRIERAQAGIENAQRASVEGLAAQLRQTGQTVADLAVELAALARNQARAETLWLPGGTAQAAQAAQAGVEPAAAQALHQSSLAAGELADVLARRLAEKP